MKRYSLIASSRFWKKGILLLLAHLVSLQVYAHDSGRVTDTTSLSSNYEVSFSEGLLSSSDPIDSAQYYINKVRSLADKVRETQNYITNLNDASLFELPAGIPRIIDGLNYDVIIEAIRLTPAYAEADIYMQFELPENGKLLTFRGKSIKFTRAGGIVGDAQLQLVGDFGINFSGDKVQLILHGSLTNTATYVNIDCDGFKSMNLDAEVKFSRDLLLPENAQGKVIEGNVQVPFKASVNNWNDLLVNSPQSLPPRGLCGSTKKEEEN